jgi:hypothetical protein
MLFSLALHAPALEVTWLPFSASGWSMPLCVQEGGEGIGYAQVASSKTQAELNRRR